MSFLVQRLELRNQGDFSVSQLQHKEAGVEGNTLTTNQYEAVSFQYLEEFRVLLCTSCRYCVLPQALDRHLKSIHHLTWRERQRYTDGIKGLDLASWPNVPHPHSDHPPIAGLSILDGYVCASVGCEYMSVTTKRMQAHWRDEHFQEDRSLATQAIRCRPAKLQTFFRGNNLRYFQVAKSTGVIARTQEKSSTRPWLPLLKNLPPATDDHETATDWMLTNSFCDFSYRSLVPVKSTTDSWRERILQAAEPAEYIRYAILSITASHIAHGYPDSRQYYEAVADRYRGMAVQKVPVRLNKGMFFEIFSFSRLMTLCYIAKSQSDQTHGQIDEQLAQPVLPEWIMVQRQGRALHWRFRGQGRVVDAMQGPAQRLFAVYKLEELDTVRGPHLDKLDDLIAALKMLTVTTVDSTCLEALDMLRKVWTISCRESIVGFRDMALMWTARIPDRFIDLVKAHDPIAMIVFAYFWVMWTFAEEQYWYMKGHAENMLLLIAQQLPREWQAWIVWPVDMVLKSKFTRMS